MQPESFGGGEGVADRPPKLEGRWPVGRPGVIIIGINRLLRELKFARGFERWLGLTVAQGAKSFRHFPNHSIHVEIADHRDFDSTAGELRSEPRAQLLRGAGIESVGVGNPQTLIVASERG